MTITTSMLENHHHHGKRKINMLLHHRQYCSDDNEDALRTTLLTMTPTTDPTSSGSSYPVSDGEDCDQTENNKRRKQVPSEETSSSSVKASTIATNTTIIGTNDSRVRSSATAHSWKNPTDHRSKRSSLPLLAIVSSSFQTLPDHDCDERSKVTAHKKRKAHMIGRTNTKSLEDVDDGETIGDSCPSFSSTSSSLWRRPYQSYAILVNSTTYTAALQDQYNCDHTPLSPRPQLFRI